jgi:hypothetical protein
MRKYTFSAPKWADRATLAQFRPQIAIGFIALGLVSLSCCVASIILCLELQIGSDVGGWLQLLGASCTDKTMTALYAALGMGQLITGGLLLGKAKEETKDGFIKRQRRGVRI